MRRQELAAQLPMISISKLGCPSLEGGGDRGGELRILQSVDCAVEDGEGADNLDSSDHNRAGEEDREDGSDCIADPRREAGGHTSLALSDE